MKLMVLIVLGASVGLLSLTQPGSNTLSTAFEARTLTIAPRMWWLDLGCLLYFFFSYSVGLLQMFI